MRLVSFFSLRHRPATPPSVTPKVHAATAIALCAVLLGSAPASAEGPPPPHSEAAPETPAARSGERSLDFYFAALAASRDTASAARARGRIEAHWNRSGSDTADLLAARAAVAVHAGERALALDLVDAAIVVAPQWPNARFHRAMIHLSEHAIDRALADLTTTLTMEPRHLAAMSALASLLDTAGRKPEALKWLRRLARLDPMNPAVAADRMEKLTIDVEGREL